MATLPDLRLAHFARPQRTSKVCFAVLSYKHSLVVKARLELESLHTRSSVFHARYGGLRGGRGTIPQRTRCSVFRAQGDVRREGCQVYST